MQKLNFNVLLFATRDFSDEEMEELDDVVGNTATNHETHAVFGAIVYAMEEAMANMTKRLQNVAKSHQHASAKSTQEDNGTKSNPKSSR
jgi:predicted MPP superfamily phosphohydrolase